MFNFLSQISGSTPHLFGIRVEFFLFALTLVGVAIFHRYTMYVALTGLVVILTFKYLTVPDFSIFHHIAGFQEEEGEWRTLLNLAGLLLGFAVLSRHFELSGVPDKLPQYLPNDWKGGLLLLFIIMVLSSFLDNIASAMIGGSIALVVFKRRLHIGYIAAIIAASNAGGAGSVLGDTTTTLMWIDGVHPADVLHAFLASFGAFAVFGIVGSLQQQKYQPIQKEATKGIKIDHGTLVIVLGILLATILANYFFRMPALGVWTGILIGALFRKTPWKEISHALPGTVFLLCLVTSASLMPVEELPSASWDTTLILGFVSSVFDNIPLTKLCLEQGGYDWGLLAYAVGFGGSMIWFGSSAGVALSNKFKEAKSVVKYVRYGWHVMLAYLLGFFILLSILGWHPVEKRGRSIFRG
ncbi:MAG: citrate transporter [Bacteroides sp. SM23_62_1]|nr:MAG: citrate transporter [Bacteroides sp. SM23_62_1]